MDMDTAMGVVRACLGHTRRIMHITMEGGPTKENMSEIAEMFSMAISDVRGGVIVTPSGVHVAFDEELPVVPSLDEMLGAILELYPEVGTETNRELGVEALKKRLLGESA